MPTSTTEVVERYLSFSSEEIQALLDRVNNSSIATEEDVRLIVIKHQS